MLNKKKIWIFGDSYSTPYSNKEVGAWAKEYIKWKGYEPKTFGDILGDELEVEVMHFGIGGIDNDTLFESIYKSAPLIQKEDIVIIGWSSLIRFRLATLQNKFATIIPNFGIHNSLSFISKNTIEEILVNRTLWSYYKELYDRIEFLNWLFKDTKLIQWTPFYFNSIKIYGDASITTIHTETNEELKDYHYSEKGHRELANTFLEFINNDKLRNKINSLCTISNLI